MKNFDGILLDFDGTFADTGEGIFYCIKEALKRMKRPLLDEAAMRTFIGPPLYASFRRECGFTEDEANEAVSIYREIYGADAYKLLSLYDGMEELIGNLNAKGVKVGIATAKPEKFAVRIIEYLGMKEQFATIVGVAEGNTSSSKKDIIGRAADNMGLPRSRVLMVGDRCYDVQGAHDAGLECVGVLYGYGTREELENSGAEYIVNTPGEIENIVIAD
ncbi:MAG: HAD hydrolase-like protein [Clostridiales bacterium]|nr:HAD hydrolase-like protein [Clostridiales bacterium]